MQFIVYTKDNCPYCVIAKNLLKREGHTYTEINVTKPEDRDAFLEKYPNFRTLPQIFYEVEDMDHYIGGSDKLQDWLKENTEDQLF